MIQPVTVMFFILTVTGGLKAQTDNNPKKIKILPVPTFGYEPETKTYLGAVSLFTIDLYRDSLTRTSNAKIEFIYTWQNQAILESEWDYFFREENWFSNGKIYFSKFPDYYYGIGSDTREESELLYNSNRKIIDINLFKHAGKQVFIGAGIRYLDYSGLSSDVTNPFPELRNTSVFGIRGAIFRDTRNNLLNSTKGKYYYTEAGYQFSRSNYPGMKVDLRNYFTFNKRYVLALRLYNNFNFETPAFFDYAILGGDEYVRGYYYGRFRDKNLSTFQAEFRFPLFWRIGMAAIGGLSSIYPDIKHISGIKPNVGGGLRFLIDKQENINLRIDYVAGTDGQTGFYISFGESF